MRRVIERSPLHPIRGGSPFFAGLVLLVWQPSADGPMELTFRIMILLTALVCLMWPFFLERTWSAVKQLHAELPWFEACHVTRYAAAEQKVLTAALARTDYRVVELDGESIRSWSDLARALGQALDDSRLIPANPRARVETLITAALKQTRRLAILWRRADVAVATDPGLLVEYTSDRTADHAAYGRRTLTFVELPAPPEAPDDEGGSRVARRLHGGAAEEATVAQSDAEGPGWAKPHPGELTD
ncbi:MAG: hypothetical protein NXI31_01095 [bacterium]|nr:hypothetical protein [bacterium]